MFSINLFEATKRSKVKRSLDNSLFAEQSNTMVCGSGSDQGNKKAQKRKGKMGKFQIVVDSAGISYDANSCDWLDYESGELLTEYVPTGQLAYLLSHNIDVEKW